MMARRLPVGPRPRRDELLSSWLARVACRYGLFAQELVDRVAVDGECPSPLLRIDDFAPSAQQVQSWAQACGIDPERLRRLTLSHRYPQRPRSWYSNSGPQWAPSATSGSTPVCFDADHDAGRDAWLRADWMLHDRCTGCHGRLCVAFRMREGRARPTCRCCGRLLSGRAGECAPRWDIALIATALAMQKQITTNVNRETLERQGNRLRRLGIPARDLV